MRRHTPRAANIELQSMAPDKSAVRELRSAAQGGDVGHVKATESQCIGPIYLKVASLAQLDM